MVGCIFGTSGGHCWGWLLAWAALMPPLAAWLVAGAEPAAAAPAAAAAAVAAAGCCCQHLQVDCISQHRGHTNNQTSAPWPPQINLSPDKARVLREAYRVLAPGGEMYFSDVYCDRRLPWEVRSSFCLCVYGSVFVVWCVLRPPAALGGGFVVLSLWVCCVL